MTDDRQFDDWQVLGILPESSQEDVFRAYSRRKAVYAEDSLASYSLLDDEARDALLAKIEEAYARIVAATADPTGAGSPALPSLDPPSGPAPNRDDRPGAYLRHARLMRRMPLAQLADETKIRSSLLELLETQAFSELPARVYVRGFVLQCAKVLDIEDPESVAEAYLAKLAEAVGS